EASCRPLRLRRDTAAKIEGFPVRRHIEPAIQDVVVDLEEHRRLLDRDASCVRADGRSHQSRSFRTGARDYEEQLVGVVRPPQVRVAAHHPAPAVAAHLPASFDRWIARHQQISPASLDIDERQQPAIRRKRKVPDGGFWVGLENTLEFGWAYLRTATAQMIDAALVDKIDDSLSVGRWL